MTIDRAKLSYVFSATGYMLSYRGKNIGGVSSGAPGDRKRPWQHVHADRKMYAEMARNEIDALVAGQGQFRFVEVINRIDKEMK